MKTPVQRICQIAALCILATAYSPGTVAHAQRCVPTPPGLLSWWRAEGNGSDFIGNNPATSLNDLGFATGKVGQAFDFNGSNSSMVIPASPTLHVGAGSGFSIETWIKPTTIDLQRPIVEWNSVTGGNPYPYGVHLWISVPVGYGDGPGCLYANVVDTDGAFHPFTSAGGLITTNAYQHVALTYDRASGQAHLYLDGDVVASQNLGTFTPQTSYNLYLGNRPDAGPGAGSWAGQMDELSIYNRALSSNEIAGIFLAANRGKCLTTNPPPAVCTPSPSSLVSWWRGEANALDQAGTNNGTLAGNTTFASGRVGQGFVFDGNGAVVQLGSPASLHLQDLTIETWIRRASTAVASLNGNGNGVVFGYNIGGYGLYLDPSGAPTLSKIGINEVKPGVTITDTNLHHVAVTKVGSTVVFYVDGVAYPAAAYDPGFTFSEDVFIGGLGNNYTFYGTVDEVSVYNSAIAANEIQAIYNAGSAGKCAVSNPPPLVSPVIVSQPTNLTVYVGSNATFRVTATGAAPLSYQWRFNGDNLPGKTSNVLSLASVQFSNAGLYSVVVSNTGGSTLSSNATLTVNPLPECASVHDGLVSWWRGENDLTDNWDGNSGTTSLSGQVRFSTGKVGRAFSISFGGIQVADSASLRLTNTLTLEAWVNPSNQLSGGLIPIISKFGNPSLVSDGNQSAYLLGLTNRGLVSFTVSATGSARTNTTLLTSQPLPENQWSLVVATYDGAELRLYVNGTLAARTNYSNGIFPGTANLGLGTIPSGSASGNFRGLLDEISIYNRALTDSEIQAIFNAGVVGKCLVAPIILTQPESQAIPLGEDVKFTVTVVGNKPYYYRWRFNGTNLPGPVLSTNNNFRLVLEKIQTNRMGNYSVVVSNAFGSTTSSNAALTLLPPPTCTDTPSGLISWWPGDSNRFDAMGINDITLSSPTRYAPGKVDWTFSFRSTSDRIQVSNSPSLNFGSNADFSIEMWIKASSINSVSTNMLILQKWDLGVGYSLSFYQGRLAFTLASAPSSMTNVSTFISPEPDLRDAMFHHVAVTVNRTNSSGGKLFVDGKTVLTFDPRPRKSSLAGSTPMYIGAVGFTTASSFDILVDEPAIYSRALSAEEIFAIRQAGAAGKCKVPPSILVQPASQRLTVGSNVTFSVTAAGSPLLRYQWLKLGQAILGATNSTYNFVVGDSIGLALYSVRVTNLFGTITSSTGVLAVNHVPAAFPQTVFLNEDTPTLITLTGSDPDGDPLAYVIVTPPVHGALSGSGSNQVYTPSLDYYGRDSFTFKVNDGLVDSSPSTVSLMILPVNDPPVAISQSVALNEDTSLAITLTGSDAEGDPLTYTVLSPPVHGTLSGTPPNLTYQPNTNYFGPDGFTFKVNDGQVDSTVATVSINVISSPDVPVAKATVSPLAQFSGLTNLVVISPNNTNATVVLDGSLSTDVENDPLQYAWLEGTNVIATGVLATNVLDVGTHIITLTVSDGVGLATDTVTLEVITPAQSVEILSSIVNVAGLSKKLEKELMGSLKESAHAFDKRKLTQGIKRLAAFQDKVRKRIAPVDQALADSLINGAQVIADALTGP